MSNVVVFVEQTNGDVKRSSAELLTAAQNSGRSVYALLVGPSNAAVAGKVAAWGVKETLVCDDSKLQNYNPELFSQAISDALKSVEFEFLLATSSMLARDVFPRVAARLDAGIASDCTELKLSSSACEVRKPLYSGKCTAAVEFQNCKSKIILMRANQLPVGEPKGGSAEVKKIALSSSDFRTQVKEVVKGVSGKLDLTEANIVVSGGRGMKGPEHFKLLEDLATTIGATVGASRAVVDAGWVPHGMQVGQTGKTVAPSLYIACGISGAIQHLAGMSGSKVIVAINKDADAPIFQKATYGIVGDVFEILPVLIEEFKKIKQ